SQDVGGQTPGRCAEIHVVAAHQGDGDAVPLAELQHAESVAPGAQRAVKVPPDDTLDVASLDVGQQPLPLGPTASERRGVVVDVDVVDGPSAAGDERFAVLALPGDAQLGTCAILGNTQ